MNEQDFNASEKRGRLALSVFVKLMLRPFKWYVVFLFSFAFVWALDTALRPYLIKIILDRLSVAQPSTAFHVLIGPLSLFAVVSLLALSGYRFYDFLIIRILPSIRKNVIDYLLGHLVHHSHSYFQNNFAGALGTRVSEIANGLRELITIFVDRFVANGLAVILAIVAISFIHWLLAVILVLWFMVFLAVSFYTSKRAYALSSHLSEATSLVIGKVVDTLSNMTAVRLFTGEKQERADLDRYTNERIVREERGLWFLFKIWLFQGVSFLITELLCILVL
ncbi:MAG: hypothetical protein K2X98_04915, partial [Alphaproteobacteria bacterium]|nr:hypothetical protein [Alphaproteobacteria bacterium]